MRLIKELPRRVLFAAGFGVLVLSLIGLYASYVGAGNPRQRPESERRLLVCSTTQLADFARNVVGDRWDVRSILAPGQDPHLYSVKPGDARLVARASLCLENGWHLEGKDWMRLLAEQAKRPLMTCVEGVEPYRLVEEGVEVHDPHAWFTVPNALRYVENIRAAVAQIDPEHQDEYGLRAQLYGEQLSMLDRWIHEQIAVIPESQRVLVTSHDAFNYFCREYGLRPASPAGWSTNEEIGGGITPQRRQRVVESIVGMGVKAIFVETSVNPKMIRVIAEEAGVRIGGELYSDSMGAAGTSGETYLGMMRENVLTVVGALR
ncbi:MAG: ABC transporter substrate-binding protein [Planctomycetes bacterium]|nr:ABC transporter substrate-binding protein [Planctomycetota bacterium]